MSRAARGRELGILQYLRPNCGGSIAEYWAHSGALPKLWPEKYLAILQYLLHVLYLRPCRLFRLSQTNNSYFQNCSNIVILKYDCPPFERKKYYVATHKNEVFGFPTRKALVNVSSFSSRTSASSFWLHFSEWFLLFFFLTQPPFPSLMSEDFFSMKWMNVNWKDR